MSPEIQLLESDYSHRRTDAEGQEDRNSNYVSINTVDDMEMLEPSWLIKQFYSSI